MSNKRVWGSQNLLSEPGVHPPLLPSRIRFSPTELFPSLLDPFFPPFHPSATGGAAWQQRASPPCTQAPPQTPNLMRAPGLLHSCPIWVKTNKQTTEKGGRKREEAGCPPTCVQRQEPGSGQQAWGGHCSPHFGQAAGAPLCDTSLLWARPSVLLACSPANFFFPFSFFFICPLLSQ